MRERWRQRVKEGKMKQIKDLTEIEQRKGGKIGRIAKENQAAAGKE